MVANGRVLDNDLAAVNVRERATGPATGLGLVSDRAIAPVKTLIATWQIGIAQGTGMASAITTAIIPVACPLTVRVSGVTIRTLGGT